MRMRIMEVSEDLYNRLHRISLLNNLEIKDLLSKELDYLEDKYSDYYTWDGFLRHTSPIFQFLLHNAIWNYDEGCHYIAVENKYAYNQLKIHQADLIKSLNSYYGKDFSVYIDMVNND